MSTGQRLLAQWTRLGAGMGAVEGLVSRAATAREGQARVVFVTRDHPLTRHLGPMSSSTPWILKGLEGKGPMIGAVVDTLEGSRNPELIVCDLMSPRPGAQWLGFQAKKGPAWGSQGISLGKWSPLTGGGSLKTGEEGRDKGSDGLDGFQSISSPRIPSQGNGKEGLLETLASPPSDQIIQTILMLTDKQPDALLHSLDQRFPGASKMGMIGASTPFTNGMPFTLFDEYGVRTEGGVGLALRIPREDGIRAPDVCVHHPGLRPLYHEGEEKDMMITRARGNVIVELDGGSATQRLLQRVQAMGRMGKGGARYFLSWDQRGGGHRVGEILSGDPGRGAMAIDTVEDLLVGTRVQWMVAETSSRAREEVYPDRAWRFEVTEPEGQMEGASSLGVGSEHGVLVGEPHRRSWVCRSPHSYLSIMEVETLA